MFILPLSSHARGKTWVTTEYQFDSRDFNTLNFTGFSALPKGFSVWGFVDFEAAKEGNKAAADAQGGGNNERQKADDEGAFAAEKRV